MKPTSVLILSIGRNLLRVILHNLNPFGPSMKLQEDEHATYSHLLFHEGHSNIALLYCSK